MELDELVSLANAGLWQAATAWDGYCEKHGYSPDATQFFAAYASRRMHGAMLDAMRSADWASRSARSRAKLLREVGQDAGLSDAELAERSGLTIQQVRDAKVSQARRPVSLDAEPGHRETVADTQDVESEVMVTHVLAAACGCFDDLEPVQQALLAFVYHQGKSIPEAGEMLDLTAEEAQAVHDTAVLAVHDAMLRAAV